MIKIWKYPLEFGRRKFMMPRGSKPLCVHEQADRVWLWAEVDDKAPGAFYEFGVFTTGVEILEGSFEDLTRVYIGSVFMDGSATVFHVYDYGEIK